MSITKPTRFNGYRLKAGFNAPVFNDNGSAILIVVIILMALTLLGLIATRTTNTEMKIAASDKRHRATFYDADGATELASELLEQNIDSLGFDGTPDFDPETNTFGHNHETPETNIGLEGLDFWRNGEEFATTPTDDPDGRDFFLPQAMARERPTPTLPWVADPNSRKGWVSPWPPVTRGWEKERPTAAP